MLVPPRLASRRSVEETASSCAAATATDLAAGVIAVLEAGAIFHNIEL